MSDTVLRHKQVWARTGLGRSSIYAMVADGKFPRPIKLGPRAVGFLASEVDAWVAARVTESRGTEK